MSTLIEANPVNNNIKDFYNHFWEKLITTDSDSENFSVLCIQFSKFILEVLIDWDKKLSETEICQYWFWECDQYSGKSPFERLMNGHHLAFKSHLGIYDMKAALAIMGMIYDNSIYEFIIIHHDYKNIFEGDIPKNINDWIDYFSTGSVGEISLASLPFKIDNIDDNQFSRFPRIETIASFCKQIFQNELFAVLKERKTH